MINELRKRFILVSSLSVAIVFLCVFAVVACASMGRLDATMDHLTATIASNGGEFPDYKEVRREPSPDDAPHDGSFTPDTQFSTRYFTVWADKNGDFLEVNTEKVAAVSASEAQKYARRTLASESDTGWVDDFRYRVVDVDEGKMAVFVNGGRDRSMTFDMLSLLLILLGISFLLIVALICAVSSKAVKPIAESSDKQKQFVTNASHELKTPLTIMMSDLDIIESEQGASEWIDDMRAEGGRMGALINQLVALAKMDEGTASGEVAEFDLAELLLDAASEFEGAALQKNQRLEVSVQANGMFKGDERLICDLIGILMDNAVKYCDEGGDIALSLSARGKTRTITVENAYANANDVDLSRIFERFYREDEARTSSGSFGVGLSIAQEIAKAHHGSIVAYRASASRIGFNVTLRSP